MAHYSRLLKVVIDAPPDLHDQELAFWAGALGQELPGIFSDEYHGAFLHGHDLMLLMQRLDAGAPRIHLDLHTDDVAAEVARLERLGAERVEQVQSWWVLRDPAGLPFCVLPIRPGSLNDENAQRWELSVFAGPALYGRVHDQEVRRCRRGRGRRTTSHRDGLAGRRGR